MRSVRDKTATVVLGPKLDPGVFQFLQATFKFHWLKRPKDLSNSEVLRYKHPGEMLNYLRNQLNVPREQMALLLMLTTNNYTNLERLGSPISQDLLTRLEVFCNMRGMPTLARYFKYYHRTKEHKPRRYNYL